MTTATKSPLSDLDDSGFVTMAIYYGQSISAARRSNGCVLLRLPFSWSRHQ